jgi:hypothetical protein
MFNGNLVYHYLAMLQLLFFIISIQMQILLCEDHTFILKLSGRACFVLNVDFHNGMAPS